MRLTKLEFWAMNNPVRRYIQKRLEFRLFQEMGLTEPGKRILEIGCGSGYGARLLATLEPASYVGIDLMPEQIERTKGTNLPNTQFAVMDATDLSAYEDGSFDYVVVFGILHHIPAWRTALSEIERVLAPGGSLFIEELQKASTKMIGQLFHWHVPEAGFTFAEFETGMMDAGLEVDPELVKIGVFSKEFGIQATQELLEVSPRPTAIFATSNRLLMGTMTALAAHEVRVPDEISVIAFDDSEWLSFWQPPITTVDIAVEEMAMLAVQLLLRWIREGHPPEKPRTYSLSTMLIERKSCKRVGSQPREG